MLCGTCHGDGEIEIQLNPTRTRVELCPTCKGEEFVDVDYALEDDSACL